MKTYVVKALYQDVRRHKAQGGGQPQVGDVLRRAHYPGNDKDTAWYVEISDRYGARFESHQLDQHVISDGNREGSK